MKTNAIKRNLPLLVLLSILLNSVSAYAQSSASKTAPATSQKVTVSQEFLQKAEEALAKLDHLERAGLLKDERLVAQAEVIKAQAELITTTRQQRDLYKESAEERAKANALDDKRVALFEQSLKDFQKQLDRVTAERDRARFYNKVLGIGAAILLAITAALAGK